MDSRWIRYYAKNKQNENNKIILIIDVHSYFPSFQ